MRATTPPAVACGRLGAPYRVRPLRVQRREERMRTASLRRRIGGLAALLLLTIACAPTAAELRAGGRGHRRRCRGRTCGACRGQWRRRRRAGEHRARAPGAAPSGVRRSLRRVSAALDGAGRTGCSSSGGWTSNSTIRAALKRCRRCWRGSRTSPSPTARRWCARALPAARTAHTSRTARAR